MSSEIIVTVKPSGGDYTSLSAAEAGEQRDLVTADEIASFECYSMQDTSQVVFDGWTSDSTRYMKIYTPLSERHDGKWNTGKYYLEVSVESSAVLQIKQQHIRIEGIQIRNTHATPITIGSALQVDEVSLGSDIRISYCIFRDGRYNVWLSACKFWNNIVYGGTLGGVICFEVFAAVLVYSCTSIGSANSGIRRIDGVVIAKNCYAKSSNLDYHGTISKTTCASGDATGSAGLQNILYDENNFTNVTPGSEDLHLHSGSNLIDVGTDTSGDSAPLDFIDDIDGENRSVPWDIGADEFVASVGVIMNQFQGPNLGADLYDGSFL